jgi:hypothetical protein
MANNALTILKRIVQANVRGLCVGKGHLCVIKLWSTYPKIRAERWEKSDLKKLKGIKHVAVSKLSYLPAFKPHTRMEADIIE